jgi:hypothetical protein
MRNEIKCTYNINIVDKRTYNDRAVCFYIWIDPTIYENNGGKQMQQQRETDSFLSFLFRHAPIPNRLAACCPNTEYNLSARYRV